MIGVKQSEALSNLALNLKEKNENHNMNLVDVNQ
tara:strand:+ start:721 stop:822 length:102 start_codon:yes stop_codon:yes gene_type:complete